VAKKYLDRIVLVRAATPDGESRIVSGAVVLGPYDPTAPKDPNIGYIAGVWEYGHAIKCYIPFSMHRYFSCKTYAGGTPKQVTDTDVLKNTRLALEVFCGLRKDE